MKTNKIIVLLVGYICCFPVFGNPFSVGYVITQDNSDATVNLRETESLHAKVLAKIPNGTPMSCSVDNSSNPSFCFVKFDQDNKINTGYIYKNRLVFLDNDKSFNKITLTKSDLYSAVYKGNQVTVKVKLKPSKLISKNFSWQTINSSQTLMYQNKPVYGVDEIVNSVYLYSTIEIEINGSKYSIPAAQFKGLFIPFYFVENSLVFKNITIYYNVEEKMMYIFSTQTDGACVYTVVFELKDNLLKKTNVWNEAY